MTFKFTFSDACHIVSPLPEDEAPRRPLPSARQLVELRIIPNIFAGMTDAELLAWAEEQPVNDNGES